MNYPPFFGGLRGLQRGRLESGSLDLPARLGNIPPMTGEPSQDPPDGVDLHPFARRVYSEAGEDGILEEIFARLGVEGGYFVEFGAWDGRHLSNTRLLAERGWSGILIESDPARFRDLERNIAPERVVAVQAKVALAGRDMLDAILERSGCPKTFDLLSIDVDGDDLGIWMTLEERRPTCVVIEFNITIPFDVDFINPPGRAWGNSARTIERVARAKGYRLVAVAKMNLVFVDAGACARANFRTITLGTRAPEAGERWFWGYDGTLIRWHPRGFEAPEFLRVPFHAASFPQPMPRPLRQWRLGHERRRAERLASLLTALAVRPFSYLRSRFRAR
jgi:hypothetical protein